MAKCKRDPVTIEELESLPIYSVILDADEIAYQHYGIAPDGPQVKWAADGGWFCTEHITLPVTVLHVGTGDPDV